MTKMLKEAVAELRTLPKKEQDRAAAALLSFARDHRDYTFTADQIAGIRHAKAQAERKEFASERRLRKIFGRPL